MMKIKFKKISSLIILNFKILNYYFVENKILNTDTIENIFDSIKPSLF